MVAKALNPMDAYRREQKKKELKKNRTERQKSKQAKLATLDQDELHDQIKKLERQVQANPADGPTRKRKQELEDTLKAVVKKQKEEEEEQKRSAAGAGSAPKSLKDLEMENRARYQSPENSVYYHPTLNPFGAPPPGKPQMYKVSPPMPASRPPAPSNQRGNHYGPRGGGASHPPRGPRGPPRFNGGSNGIPPPPPRPAPGQVPVAPKRPGKRPPLPPGPIPPGIIQVPPRPPLPPGPVPQRPPPPPSAVPSIPPPPPIPTPVADISHPEEQVQGGDFDEHLDSVPMSDVVAPYPPPDDMGDVVAPYPPPDDAIDPDEQMDEEEKEEQLAQLRSLVPVALRVQRKQAPRAGPPVPRPLASVPGPRPPPPLPRPSAPGPPLAPAAPAAASKDAGSVSKEFDAFMDEVKDLL